MSKVEIDWYHDEGDLDDALQEFREYWSEHSFEVDYNYETDYQGRELIAVTITSRLSMRDFEAVIEGTSIAEGAIDILDDYTPAGTGVSYKYL